jgi:hypothetical protein
MYLTVAALVQRFDYKFDNTKATNFEMDSERNYN